MNAGFFSLFLVMCLRTVANVIIKLFPSEIWKVKVFGTLFRAFLKLGNNLDFLDIGRKRFYNPGHKPLVEVQNCWFSLNGWSFVQLGAKYYIRTTWI